MKTFKDEIMITLDTDSGKFLGFNVLLKQHENAEMYDQWRTLTLEEAKKVEAAVLLMVYQVLLADKPQCCMDIRNNRCYLT
jgi:hypothetical protein